jgi:type 1 glutamine amidotransferase/Spy/CpxP family protein refolding chaperone
MKMFLRFIVATATGTFVCAGLGGQTASAKPAHSKRLLLVTTTLGFRHAAVTVQEELIREMAASTGEFTIISTSDSPDFPAVEYQSIVDQRNARIPLNEAKDNDKPPFLDVYGGLPRATPQQEAAVTKMMNYVDPFARTVVVARAALAKATYSEKPDNNDITAKTKAVADAELALASARAESFVKLQDSPQRLTPEQTKVIVQLAAHGTGDVPRTTAPDPTPEQQVAITSMNSSISSLSQAASTARIALSAAPFADKPDKAEFKAKAEKLASADIAYANATATAFAKLQSTSARLLPEQVHALAQSMGSRGGFGTVRPTRPDPSDPMTARVAKILQQYLSPEALKNYDAVAFLSTTGELPIPDKDAFFKWIADGHGFIGLHSATDTLHGTPEYIRMIGAEFAGHGRNHAREQVFNTDPKSPLTAGWSDSIALNEEFYLFKKFDSRKVHVLLEMKEQPYTKEVGEYPVSWIKMYGQGRMFYTSLGHRDDVLSPSATIGDQQFKIRYNKPEVAQAVDRNILNGIRWALGLINADATPQVH